MDNQDPTQNYGAEAWRAPVLADGETLIFSECGRLLPSSLGIGEMVSYRAYYFRVVKPEIGQYRIIVKHGAGQEGFNLTYDRNNTLIALAKLDSDARYAMLWQLYETWRDTKRATAAEYCQAFAEGRLKKRKRNKQYHVYIEAEKKENTQ